MRLILSILGRQLLDVYLDDGKPAAEAPKKTEPKQDETPGPITDRTSAPTLGFAGAYRHQHKFGLPRRGDVRL